MKHYVTQLSRDSRRLFSD